MLTYTTTSTCHVAPVGFRQDGGRGFNRLVWLFAINRTTIPRIYNCSELVYAIVDLDTVGLSVMYARLVWLFAINRTTIPRIYNCSELVCAIVDLDTVVLSVMCVRYGHNLFIYLCKS